MWAHSAFPKKSHKKVAVIVSTETTQKVLEQKQPIKKPKKKYICLESVLSRH